MRRAARLDVSHGDDAASRCDVRETLKTDG